MFIYKITNIINKKSYIGQTCSKRVEARWSGHKSELRRNIHCNPHLQSSWNKYGEDSFIFSVLETTSLKNLDERELFWTLHFKTYLRSHGYNKIVGGKTNRFYSEETKQKMRGRVMSLENRKNMSNLAKKRIGKLNPFYGKNHSEEFKAKLSNSKCKKVLCLTNNKIYDSAKVASKELNISQSYITHCCAGRYLQAKGLSFKYA